MQNYFLLQFQLLQRRIQDFGLAPWLAFVLGLIAYAGISWLLFSRTEYAGYIVLGIGGMTLLPLSSARRNHFLKNCFPNILYRRLRLLENGIVVFPFAFALVFFHQWWQAGAMVGIAGIMAFVQIRAMGNFSIPTPFGRRPFEFATGFRKMGWLFPILGFVAVMAFSVLNFNLAAFTQVAMVLVCFTFYGEPEPPEYVWIFAKNPRQFLFAKIRTGLLYASVFSLPVAIASVIFFPEWWYVTLVIQIVAYLYLTMFILAKYAAFPQQIGLPQAVMLGLTLWLPPLLFAMIPIFYQQSLKKLEEILT